MKKNSLVSDNKCNEMPKVSTLTLENNVTGVLGILDQMITLNTA